MNFSLIPAAINHLLMPEAHARRKLAAHAGKTACIDAGVATIRLRIAGDGLVQMIGAEHDAASFNVTIHIKPADLPLILQDRARAVSYVRIDGDADLAAVIAQVAQSVRWDAEGDASRVLGDIAGARLVGATRAAFAAAKDVQRQIAENTAEYFLEEKPMLMRPQAVTEFASDVSKLRDDVERLAKRIERLDTKKGSNKAGGAA